MRFRLALLVTARPRHSRRSRIRATVQRGSWQDAAGLRRWQRVVPGPACGTDVPELPGKPEETVRLRARHRHQRPAARPAGLGQRLGDLGAPQRVDGSHRAAVVRLRDDSVQRADERDHESRTGPRRDDGPGGGARPVLPAAVRRQGHAAGRAARIGALFLPDHAAGGRAALVSRRQRRVRGHVDGRRHRPRAGGLRRDGLPRDGPRQRALLRSARAGVRGHEDRLPAPDQLVSLRHAVPDVAGAHLLARAGAGLDGAQAGQPRLLRQRSSATSSAGRWKARGPTGSSPRRPSRRRTSRRSASTRSRRTATSPRARWARCRAPTTTRRATASTRHSTTPAWSRTSAPST